MPGMNQISSADRWRQALGLSVGNSDYRRRLWHNGFWVLYVDSAVLLAALMLSGWMVSYIHPTKIMASRGIWLIPAWWLGAFWLRLIPGWGNGPVEDVRRCQTLLAGLFVLAAALLYLSRTGDITSRLKVLLMYLLCVPALPLARTLTRYCLGRAGRWGVPVVIYGNDQSAAHVLHVLQREPGLGFQPSGLFDDDEPVGSHILGVPVLGGLRDTTDQASVALLAAPAMRREDLVRLLDGPLAEYQKVIIIPDLLDIPSLWVQVRDFMGVPGLEVTRNLLNPTARLAKHGAEYLFTLLTLPLWLPLLLVLAAVIRWVDHQAPFFHQERIGLNGRRFMTWKFRTMDANAEARLEEALSADPALAAEWATANKLRQDPRITRLGRWLRRTSLDELPQLLNVLRGEMALVGPRPLPGYHHQKLPTSIRSLRERVLPGITGLWQVSGRSATGDEGLERWDAYYVRNWSPWLDLVILARTARAVWTGEGAY